MEQWTSTQDTRVAAALGTMGVIIRLHRTFRDRTGVTDTRFHLSLTNTDGDVVTKRLLSRWKNGRLQQEDPGCDLLTCLRVIENRALLLDCANKGARIELVQVPGTDVWQYVPGKTGLPGTNGHPALIETTDLKMAAALGLIGVPVLAIAGSRGNYRFYLPIQAPPRRDGSRPDPLALRAAWYRDMRELPWAEPFAKGCRTLYNRERLLDAVNRELPLVLLEKPRSVKAALIHPEATKAAWDEVKQAFDS